MAEKQKFRPPLSIEELDKLSKDFAKEEAKLEVIKQDFKGFKAQKEKEFEASLDNGSLLSDDEVDIIEVGTNVGDIYRLLKSKETEFVNVAVEEQEQQIEAFEDELHHRRGQLDLLTVETNFMQNNPDADFESLVDFIEKKLTGEDTETLNKEANGDQLKFLELINAKMNGDGRKEEKDDELPTDLSGVAGASGNVDEDDRNNTEDESNYLKSVGLA